MVGGKTSYRERRQLILTQWREYLQPNIAVHGMTRGPSPIDFPRPDLEIFNDTASLIAKFNSDLGIFPSSYLSPSVVSPAMFTRPLSISCASQGKAARPRVEKRGLKEGELQPITGH